MVASRTIVGQLVKLMPLVFPMLGTCINRGAVPLDRGRRPRRPARTLQDADPICSRCGTKASRADQGGLPHNFRSIADRGKTSGISLASCAPVVYRLLFPVPHSLH